MPCLVGQRGLLDSPLVLCYSDSADAGVAEWQTQRTLGVCGI